MPVIVVDQPEVPAVAEAPVSLRQRLLAHVRITRLDHSIKQAFILPGILLAMALDGRRMDGALAVNVCIGLLSATLIASSNYVINEMLDAPFDRLHPTKKNRPSARGLVHVGWGYVQWIAMMLAGLALASMLSRGFLLSALALWIMGCVYNIHPVRSKDLPYIDVLSESVNNPLRFCLGWYMVTAALLPPLSLLLSYWMLGAYFMALKRFSEYRQIADFAVAASYRNRFVLPAGIAAQLRGLLCSRIHAFFWRVHHALSDGADSFFSAGCLVDGDLFRTVVSSRERGPKPGKALSRATSDAGAGAVHRSLRGLAFHRHAVDRRTFSQIAPVGAP